MEEQLKNLASLLEKEIQALDLPKSPENLYNPLRYFLDFGGKRIRPILTVLGAEIFGKTYDDVLHAALAIEYFHNFSLIHDDIMDEAPLRRAKQTVHEKWNANVAILSGDVLLIKAYQELCKQEAKHIPDLISVFNKTAIEVCEGQQMDMDFEQRNTISISEYIEMIRLKTSVLLGCALEFAAIISDIDLNQRQAIYNFGQYIGIAFQIQDDFLDLYADADKFGKQIGGDIISNKKTIIVLKAFELATPLQKEFLLNLQQITNAEEKVKQTLSIFAEIGVKDEVVALRNHYIELGLNELHSLKSESTNKKKLISLVEYLKTRES
jgi:geranylgeranyl diphosphate synthase type II